MTSMENSRKYSDDLFLIAYCYDELGNYRKALYLYKESANIIRYLEGIGLKYAYRNTNIGIIYIKLREYDKAIKLLKNANDIYYMNFGSANREFIDSLTNIGNAYLYKENYSAAFKKLDKAFSLRREHIKEKDHDYINNLNSLALACRELGRFSEAIIYMGEALDIIRVLDGPVSLSYFKLSYDLGYTYYKNLYYKKAEEYFSEFISLAPAFIDKNNVYYILGLFYLSECQRQLGEVQKSLDNKNKLLDIWGRIFDKENIVYANILVSLALLYRDIGSFIEASDYCKQSLIIKEKLVGTNNISYISDLKLISILYFEAGHYNSAIWAVNRLSEIFEINEDLIEKSFGGENNMYLYIPDMEKAFVLDSYIKYNSNILDDVLDEIYNYIDKNIEEKGGY